MSEQILQNAWRLHQAGNLNEAARLYQDVLKTNPRNFNALQLLGFVHFQRGEFADAERIMEKAIRINPSSVDALYNRGCALQALERLKEALQCLGKALTEKNDFVLAHVAVEQVVAMIAQSAVAEARLVRGTSQPRQCAAGAESAARRTLELRQGARPRATRSSRLEQSRQRARGSEPARGSRCQFWQ